MPKGVYPRTEYHRRINSEGHKGKPSWNKGLPMSESHKAALSRSTRGKRNDGRPMTGRYLEAGYWYLTSKHDHPLARTDGTVAEHRKVLWDKIGAGFHSCHWGCGRLLTWGGLLQGICADHLDRDRSNNAPENLVPSCYLCNWRRHQ